jgi:hypothetical protein
VPLSRPKNSSLQNHCFSTKKGDAKNQTGYAYGCYSEIEVSQSADWRAEEILIRGVRLLTFMQQRWSLSLGDSMERARILGLDFLLRKNPALKARLQ